MNQTDLAQDANVPVSAAHRDGVGDETIQSWTNIARRYYPNLATPIARALAQRAAQGPYGLAMQSIAHGMAQFDPAALGDMTGSELQMLSALLMNLQQETQHLLVQVQARWRAE